jgi:hypothetical protein
MVKVIPLEWGSSFVVVASICLSASSVVVSVSSLTGCVGSEVLLALVEGATHALIVEFAARAQFVEEITPIRFVMLGLLVVESLVLGSKMRMVLGSGVFLVLTD